MLENEDLLESLGLHSLVPAALAPWRPLLVEALAFFLERLPAHRQAAIVSDQLALPAAADAAERLAVLFAYCPTLHKLGQVIARQSHLHPELRRRLQGLESMPAATPIGAIVAAIRAEIGGAVRLALADRALAEGSVAVVLPFAYRAGGALRHGVFKVLKPGIELKLAEEIAVLPEVARFLQSRGRRLGLPDIDYGDILGSVRKLLTREIRLTVEQGNMRAAAALYADQPDILVPRLLPWCTPRLTAMERVFGSKVTDAVLSGKQRREIADTMISALLAKPFWTRSADALFHADLHAGNLLVAEDGRLAVLDWSLTARLAKPLREALVSIALGGLTLDPVRIRRALATLAGLDAEHPALAAAVERALDRLVLHGGLPGFDWLLDMLDHLALGAMARFHEDFTLFRKTWLSLSGVMGDLVGGASPDMVLLRTGIRQFLAELPARWLARPHSADFSTHISNADLAQVCGASWLTAQRYCTRFAQLAGAPALKPA